MNNLNSILHSLENGDLSVITNESTELINRSILSILNKQNHDTKDIMNIGIIIKICNILYNNTDIENLPVDDGVYDILLELYKEYNPSYLVGAEPINFNNTNQSTNIVQPLVYPIARMDKSKKEDFIFIDDISKFAELNKIDFYRYVLSRDRNNEYISKRVTNIKHVYPELVGTLDKCKFVLNSQAITKGVFEDSNVKIVERDFFYKLIQDRIISPNESYKMILELKYDGISIEAEVTNKILNARGRGDANEDIAADLTPILGDYVFKHAPEIPEDEKFGMKFEAIMTYDNLYRFNMMKNNDYKNCRTAISGLFSSSDAYKYRDLITLVPLATSLNLDRLVEVEFMNKYYHSGELLRYSVIEGDYKSLLFQIKRFVEEAEYMRQFMPFMYDGVVISFIDENIKEKLGRKNAVNKYSMAIKFNPIQKLTVFRGYSFTVGQDGTITPMIHYDPVEFYGTIHTKSSGHSYDRFKALNLRLGDVLSVEYVNDVMPYVSKPDNSSNASNQNPIVPFITKCPSCGSDLQISNSGKSVKCVNINCPERNIARMVSMMQKLNIKDFSEAYLTKISKYTLNELLNLTVDDVSFLGELTSIKFIDRMNDLKTKPIYDYQIIGSLGFTNTGRRKWKLILNKISLSELLSLNKDQIRNKLLKIKGIGPMTIDIIINEFDFFKNDLVTINNMTNIIMSKGLKLGKKIRLTGFRNIKLIEHLNELGHDAGEGSVTKDTDILLVPIEGYTSSKTQQAMKNEATQIVPVSDFIDNMDKYLK